MSRRAPQVYPWGNEDPPIVPTEHDVLSGRGVNIAQHPGNERFRTLINSRYDTNYCSQYSTSEKRAVAREVIAHVQSLVPSGRFLKRLGRSKNSRGLEGPWEELSEQDSIKKTCQALRDCNRQDRTGYAATVIVPEDVRHRERMRSQSGLSNKQYAEQAAAVTQQIRQHQAQEQVQYQQQEQAVPAPVFNMSNLHNTIGHNQDSNSYLKRPRADMEPQILSIATTGGTISPSIEQGATWLKKQRTPTTAASSIMLQESTLLDSVPSSSTSPHDHPQGVHHHHHGFLAHSGEHMPTSPVRHFDHLAAAFPDSFAHADNGKPHAQELLDPLQLAAAAIESAEVEHHHYGILSDDFPPPSPLHHPDHHHHHLHTTTHHHHGELAHDRFED